MSNTRRTRWYNSLTLRLLLLFWALLFLTASSGFLLAIWQTKTPTPEPLAAEVRRTLEPLLEDPQTFLNLQPGRLIAGDYRVAARLNPSGQQQLLIADFIAARQQQLILRQIDAGRPEQLQLENQLLIGPFENGGTRILVTRPLNAEELRQREANAQQAREARTLTLIVGSGVVAVLLGFWLIRPIQRLIRATREIAAGSATPTLKNLPRRRDEVGELARALHTTAHDLAVSRDAQRRLLSDVSHELRSPLARMQMALSLVEPTSTDDHTHWQQLERDVSRLGSIIDRILSLSRLENGLVQLNREAVDLRQLATQLVEDLGYVDSAAASRVQVIDSDHWLSLHSDPELIRLIIENLVRNALQYTDQQVEIHCNGLINKPKSPPLVQLLVRDYGTGVSDDQLVQLFEPFYRGDPSRHHQAGVGLGMALSRRAAGVLGGYVTARNHPDGGLEVQIQLGYVALDETLTDDESSTR